MRKMRSCLAAVAVVAMSSVAMASPKVALKITGTAVVPAVVGAVDVRFGNAGFGIQYDGGGTGGGFDIQSVGAFDVLQEQVFSDPEVVADPTVLAQFDTGTFAYYGIARTYDTNGAELDKRVFAALKPGVGAGLSLADAFAGFLGAHPGLTTGELAQAIEDGPDFPTPGGNALAIDLIGYVFGGNLPGGNGKLDTLVQTGDTFELVGFDPTTGGGAVYGTIAVQVVAIPEPSAVGVLGVAGMLLGRRRRSL